MNNILTINNLSFSYTEYDSRTCLPSAGKEVLRNINLSVPEGSFITLCGATGSGKSTLLKLIKRDITPAGKMDGAIIFRDKNINDIPAGELASRIGLVFQNPDDQIVTNKVWHEIAFGLESQGSDRLLIQNRLAEIMSFLRLEKLAYENTADLSGGQKQLVSLAGVMAMYPDLLLLDEPTSQLDPENSEIFINTLKKIQKSLGMTVVIAEHNLDNLLPVTDYLAVMEDGCISAFGTPSEVINALSAMSNISANNSVSTVNYLPSGNSVIYDFPLASRLGVFLKSPSLPFDVNSARTVLRNAYVANKNFSKTEKELSKSEKNISEAEISLPKSERSFSETGKNSASSGRQPGSGIYSDAGPLIELKNIYFRYSLQTPDIISDISGRFYPGRIYALHGCNASGKSTLLGVLGGWHTPQSGKMLPKPSRLKIACLPQNPDNLFVCDTIRKDLKTVGLTEDMYPDYISFIDPDRSPFDLSGGEKQLLGLAKVTASSPEILLLDEPTKGTDKSCRKKLLKELFRLKESGVCIIMACHDMDFSAECADECCIMSMGRLTGFLPAGEFFIRNRLYTTAARRISRDILPDLYLEEELFSCLQ